MNNIYFDARHIKNTWHRLGESTSYNDDDDVNNNGMHVQNDFAVTSNDIGRENRHYGHSHSIKVKNK